jgi:hypothetical protein
MAKVNVRVLVDEGRRSSIDQIAKSLEDKGLTVSSKSWRARSIYVSGDSSQIGDLKSVEGVEDVRFADKFQLPPMDEKIPQ